MSTSLSASAADAPAQLHEITAAIQALKGEAAAVLYQLGLLLLQVDVAPTTARRAVHVARYFNEEIATRYGEAEPTLRSSA